MVHILALLASIIPALLLVRQAIHQIVHQKPHQLPVQYAETVQAVQIPAPLLPAGQQTATAAVQEVIALEELLGQEAAMHLLQTILLATAPRNARLVMHALEALLELARHIIPIQAITADSTMEVQSHAVLQTTSALQEHTSRHTPAGQAPHIPTASQRLLQIPVQYAETVQAVQIHALLLPAGQQTATAAVLVYTAVALWVTANHLLALVLPATALSNALQEYAMLPANVQINIHQEQTSAAITTGLHPHAPVQ
jgi:hypothetical protein